MPMDPHPPVFALRALAGDLPFSRDGRYWGYFKVFEARTWRSIGVTTATTLRDARPEFSRVNHPRDRKVPMQEPLAIILAHPGFSLCEPTPGRSG